MIIDWSCKKLTTINACPVLFPLAIDSLTVDPKFFRKGIASQLISYILDLFEFTEAIVETAVANDPAINLYKKYGFVEFKQWTPAHGIRKVVMSLKKAF